MNLVPKTDLLFYHISRFNFEHPAISLLPESFLTKTHFYMKGIKKNKIKDDHVELKLNFLSDVVVLILIIFITLHVIAVNQ